jgi:hypothetical protein
VLNCIIPHFEKNPTDNAKYIVKLILEKGVDPNCLLEKFLDREAIDQHDNILPERIMDVSPVALACIKYQNNALNFIIKYNSTIREINLLDKQLENTKKTRSNYEKLINELDASKQQKVRKFFAYIEDISKMLVMPVSLIVKEHLKLFDFNLLSGAHLMPPLHFAV